MTDELSEMQVRAQYEKLRMRFQNGVGIDGVRLNLTLNGGLLSTETLDFRMNERAFYACLSFAYKESKENKHGTP